MCTLEPLGYASGQYFTIPYLVLFKCVCDFSGGQTSSANLQVLELVQETCQAMIRSNRTFRGQIVDQVSAFVTDPLSRTADVVSDVRVLAAQLLSWLSLPEEERKVESADPQAAFEEEKKIEAPELKTFTRYVIEEHMRRIQKKDGADVNLSLLCPGYTEVISQFKERFRQAQVEEVKSSSAGDDMSGIYAIAAQIRRAEEGEEFKADDDQSESTAGSQ